MYKIKFERLNKILVSLIWILFCMAIEQAHAQKSVALYSGIGTWTDGLTALEHFFNWAKIDFNYITENELNYNKLSNYKILVMPGGSADEYADYIKPDKKVAIQTFIKNGGSYLGICAGSYFATKTTIWEGTIIQYGLNLFNGTAIGPITNISPWPYYTLTKINFNTKDSINAFISNYKFILYYGGPYFIRGDSSFDTIATFDNYEGKPAIIKFNYFQGRVVLISPHPEIEENSMRDGTDFASNLHDPESDWDVLYYSILWLMHQNEGQIQTSTQKLPKIAIFPNPVCNNLYIRTNTCINTIRIYNLYGQLLKDAIHTSYIDVSGLLSGTYILEITTSNSVIRQKFVKL